MDSYTITIAPNDDSGAVTRLIVDTSGDQVHITDVHLHAPHGLSSGHIPGVDFELLLRAVTGAAPAPSDQNTAPAALPAAQPDTPVIESAEPPAPATTGRSTARAARKATRTTGVRPTQQSAEDTPSRGNRDVERTATQRHPNATSAARADAKTSRTATPAKARSTSAKRDSARRDSPAPGKKQPPAKRAHAATGTTDARAYRRAPEDLAGVWQRTGSVAQVAAHYQVPRHTAQGWVSRLRATK